MQDKISALRLAVAGAFSLTVLFILCWLGALILACGPHPFVHLALYRRAGGVACRAAGG